MVVTMETPMWTEVLGEVFAHVAFLGTIAAVGWIWDKLTRERD